VVLTRKKGEPLGMELQAPLIKGVVAGGVAARFGVQPGSVLISVDGQPTQALPQVQVAKIIRGCGERLVLVLSTEATTPSTAPSPIAATNTSPPRVSTKATTTTAPHLLLGCTPGQESKEGEGAPKE